MSRIALGAVLAAALATVATVAAVSCSKSGSKDATKTASGGPEVIAVPVPGVQGAAGVKGAAESVPMADDPSMKLKPDEGQLSIEVPPDAQAGMETTAKVIVTPGPKFKINFEYPTKLSLQAAANVTIPKAEYKAGGPSAVKGDAEKFEEKQLAFAVKLTPTASGNHTINGSFKFAVCDKDQCLAKREAIAIQVPAK